MKSNMLQIVMTILAILFAMALALTVALICLSYSDRGYETDTANTPLTEERDSTSHLPPASKPSPDEGTQAPEESDTTTAEEETTAPPEERGNGLSYATNGDGTCALIGLGKCDDVCIVIPETSPAGDLVTSIAPKAFYGCTFATAIQIPATIAHIGDLAFASCPSLVYLSVDLANPYYCDIDGILYTADGSTLLTYPAMRAGSEITIGSVTTEIAEMAFYNCAYLTHITYTGSADQWETITIGAKNHSLTAASKSFYGGK